MIKENTEEYIVEFSVTIVDPTYSELLSDPKAPHHSDITRELTGKVGVHRKHPEDRLKEHCAIYQDLLSEIQYIFSAILRSHQ